MLDIREVRQAVKGDTHYLAKRVFPAPIVVTGVHHVPNMAVCLFSHSAVSKVSIALVATDIHRLKNQHKAVCSLSPHSPALRRVCVWLELELVSWDFLT